MSKKDQKFIIEKQNVKLTAILERKRKTMVLLYSRISLSIAIFILQNEY